MKTLIHLFGQFLVLMVLVDICIILIPKPIRYVFKQTFKLSKKLIFLVIIQVCNLCGIKIKKSNSKNTYKNKKNNVVYLKRSSK